MSIHKLLVGLFLLRHAVPASTFGCFILKKNIFLVFQFKMFPAIDEPSRKRKIDSINLTIFLQEANITNDLYYDLQHGLENDAIDVMNKKRKIQPKSKF